MNTLFANQSLTKEEKYGTAFINAVIDYRKRLNGGTKQEIISRFLIVGMSSDPSFREDFEAFRKAWFEKNGDCACKEYVDHVLGRSCPKNVQ